MGSEGFPWFSTWSSFSYTFKRYHLGPCSEQRQLARFSPRPVAQLPQDRHFQHICCCLCGPVLGHWSEKSVESVACGASSGVTSSHSNTVFQEDLLGFASQLWCFLFCTNLGFSAVAIHRKQMARSSDLCFNSVGGATMGTKSQLCQVAEDYGGPRHPLRNWTGSYCFCAGKVGYATEKYHDILIYIYWYNIDQ